MIVYITVEVPLGFRCNADQHSKNTHRLPIPPKSIGERDYGVILDEISNFSNLFNHKNKKEIIPYINVQQQILKFKHQTTFDNTYKKRYTRQHKSLNHKLYIRCKQVQLRSKLFEN